MLRTLLIITLTTPVNETLVFYLGRRRKLRTSDNLLMNKRYNLRLGSLWVDGCFSRAWRSASVAPLSSRYSDLPTLAQTLPQVFSVGRVIAVPVPGRGALSLWTYSAIPTGVDGPPLQTTA